VKIKNISKIKARLKLYFAKFGYNPIIFVVCAHTIMYGTYLVHHARMRYSILRTSRNLRSCAAEQYASTAH